MEGLRSQISPASSSSSQIDTQKDGITKKKQKKEKALSVNALVQALRQLASSQIVEASDQTPSV